MITFSLTTNNDPWLRSMCRDPIYIELSIIKAFNFVIALLCDF